MRAKAIALQPDLDVAPLIERACLPDLSSEERDEVRAVLLATFGPYADPILRACTKAAASGKLADKLMADFEARRLGAQLRGIAVRVTPDRVHVLLGGAERLLPRTNGITVGLGQTVLTDVEGRSIIAVGDFLVGGQTFAFCEHLEDRVVLLQPLRESPDADARLTALVSDAVDLGTLAPGDRVLAWTIDGGNLVLVTRRLGALHPAKTDDAGPGRAVRRDDLIGLDDILDRLDRLFLEPATPAYAALLRAAERGLVGAVLQGPPGCAKTLVAEYMASLVRARGGDTLYRTASYYLSKWVGEGAALVRTDFAVLERAYAETGVRPLLVVDELEAIALERSQGWTLRAGHIDVLDTLLACLTRTRVRMIGISNLADRFLDSALVRAGRLPVIPFPATLAPEHVTELVARCVAAVELAAEDA